MSQPEQPPDPPHEISYQTTPPPTTSPEFLVRLAAIFFLIVAGLDGLITLLYIGEAFLFPWITSMARVPGAPATAAPPMWLIPVLMGFYCVVSISGGLLMLVVGRKLLKRTRNCRIWGIVGACVCFVHLWCSIGCLLPIGAGIYALIILLRQDVTQYLESSPNNAFPVQPPAPPVPPA